MAVKKAVYSVASLVVVLDKNSAVKMVEMLAERLVDE